MKIRTVTVKTVNKGWVVEVNYEFDDWFTYDGVDYSGRTPHVFALTSWSNVEELLAATVKTNG